MPFGLGRIPLDLVDWLKGASAGSGFRVSAVVLDVEGRVLVTRRRTRGSEEGEIRLPRFNLTRDVAMSNQLVEKEISQQLAISVTIAKELPAVRQDVDIMRVLACEYAGIDSLRAAGEYIWCDAGWALKELPMTWERSSLRAAR